MLGTPGYQAPEVALGIRYSGAVDMFSLGVLTYVLLCGYMPLYENEGPMQTLLFPEVDWDEISEQAKAFVTCLIQYDADQRIDAEAALRHPWLGSGTALAEHDHVLHTVQILRNPLSRNEIRMRSKSYCAGKLRSHKLRAGVIKDVNAKGFSPLDRSTSFQLKTGSVMTTQTHVATPTSVDIKQSEEDDRSRIGLRKAHTMAFVRRDDAEYPQSVTMMEVDGYAVPERSSE